MYLYFNIYTLKIDLENLLLKIRFFATQDVSETLFIKMYTLNSKKHVRCSQMDFRLVNT